MSVSNIIDVVDKIIYFSKKLDLMLFENVNNKWKLKYNSLQLLKKYRDLLHENFCIRIKMLHDSYDYKRSIVELTLLQAKLQIVDNITKLLREYYILNKKQTKNKYTIIESFSTNYV